MQMISLRPGLSAETALADAYRFSGGPAPGRGLVLGRGKASFRLGELEHT